MPWFMVDDQFAMNKKVAAAGNAAMGLWVRSGSWSQRELTGGFIPKDIARSLGAPSQAKALVSAGLWLLVEGGYLFHDWDKYQMSVEEMKERKQKRADAGRLGGQASGQSRRAASAEASASATAQQNVEQKRTPVPVPVLSLVTSGGELTSVADPEPPRFCSEHPEDTTDPCIPCREARLAHKAWIERQKEHEQLDREERKRRQESCPRCEGTNTYDDERGTHKCDHQVAAHA